MKLTKKIKKIPLKPYKKHQGKGTQLGYRGVALTRKEQSIFLKINEIIEELNKR